MIGSIRELEHPRLRIEEGKELPEHEDFTTEKLGKRRLRENKPFYPMTVYFNKEAKKDGILHFAHGIGNDNPLFCDENIRKEYEEKKGEKIERWGGGIDK